MSERIEDPRIKEYIDKGYQIYSISKINSFDNCPYEYYLNYIKKLKSKDNIYTYIGSCVHDIMENYLLGKETSNEKMLEEFEICLQKASLKNLEFPSERIKKSLIKNLKHFLNNFKGLSEYNEFLTEPLAIYEPSKILKFIIRGYIDVIAMSDDGIDILDWKTSSMFSGKKVLEAGRQLVIYKLAFEQMTGLTVNRVGWIMVKYCELSYKQKNGKIKTKIIERQKVADEVWKLIESSYTIDLELEMAKIRLIRQGTLEVLPQRIIDGLELKLNDHIKYYDPNMSVIEEIENYITTSVNKINEMKDFKPAKFDKKNEFYHVNLCGHKENCRFYKAYIDEDITIY
jgi:RecB family exonuclease